MQRLTVPVSGRAAAAVLDRLLPLAPLGVHERPAGLVTHADEMPPPEQIAETLGVERVEIASAEDDVAARLRVIARPEPVDGRMLVRAAWMEPIEGMQEVVLERANAFGTGAHPTTRACLSMLMSLPPGGAFADLGCGAGVLAIAAAKLGWAPVAALDVAERAVRATRANATANGVDIEVATADLLAVAPPGAATAAANVPTEVHVAMAQAWETPPQALIVSGVHTDDRATVLGAYGARGLGVAEERELGPWLTLLLRQSAPVEAVDPAEAEIAPTQDPADPPEEAPAATGERVVELGARVVLFDLPYGVHFDAWALEDSLRWALRGPVGTTMHVEDETRLAVQEDESGERPASTVRVRVRVDTPAARQWLTVYLTVASAGAGLVRLSGSARVTAS